MNFSGLLFFAAVFDATCASPGPTLMALVARLRGRGYRSLAAMSTLATLATRCGDLNRRAGDSAEGAINAAARGRAKFCTTSRADVRKDARIGWHDLGSYLGAGRACDAAFGNKFNGIGHGLWASNLTAADFRRASP